MRLKDYKTQLDKRMNVYIDKIRFIFDEIREEIHEKIVDTETGEKWNLPKQIVNGQKNSF